MKQSLKQYLTTWVKALLLLPTLVSCNFFKVLCCAYQALVAVIVGDSEAYKEAEDALSDQLAL